MIFAQNKFDEIEIEFQKGNYLKTKNLINELIINNTLSDIDKLNLQFKIDLMNRIELDFSKTSDQILQELKKYYPDVNEQMLIQWEADGSLEMQLINGEKRYFKNAVPNLFRINKEAKFTKEKVDGIGKDILKEFLNKNLPEVINEYEKTKLRYLYPIRIKLKYSVTLKPNVVPEGEIIRCWLPFPREGNPRQADIKLISTNTKNYIIADNDNLQRTIYLEKECKKDTPTIFQIELSFISKAEFVDIFSQKEITFDQNKNIVGKYTQEIFPHIVFTNEIKNLSKQIIGDEKNNLKKLKLIYEWINKNIPWTSALEYSTINNISEYCVKNMHGDCGIKSMLFITLARFNGIPAKWESGWMLHPDRINLHDWTEIYTDEFGWIPVDVDFGLQNFDDTKLKYFYIGGIDSYRFIVNDDFSQSLYPMKIYPRSETVDFQRGELEWRGGNLFFDKWNYDMQIEYEKIN
ncbi:MAG: transglutaminase domain-containing protein [Ignavibacterium sp.]